MINRPLSVIIPALNEETTIAKLLTRVLEQSFVGQVIVVDDGSKDETGAIVRRVQDPRVTVISHRVTKGKGAAIRTGLRWCTGDFVAIQDADLEYDPSELSELLGPLLSGKADAVFGSRFLSRGERRALYFWHTVGNKALTLLSNMASNLNLTDMETCYKVFRRTELNRLRIQEDGFGIEPELTIKAALNQLRIYEVGISYHGRTYEEGKKIGWKDGLEAVRCIAQYSLSVRLSLHRRKKVLAQLQQPELEGSLESLRGMDNYYNWIYGLAFGFLGETVLEVGAGVGTFTRYLSRQGRRVFAVEPDDGLMNELKLRFANAPNVTCLRGTLHNLDQSEAGAFDSAVLINVLEHIDDDVGELQSLATVVRPGGYVLLWVPSHEWLYSKFDLALGHFRRYSRKSLTAAVEHAGLEVVDVRYLNPLGAFGWMAVAKVLGRRPTNRRAAEAFDRFAVPSMQNLGDRCHVPFGQSLWLVAKVPLES